mgnify:CR=1 FL=1
MGFVPGTPEWDAAEHGIDQEMQEVLTGYAEIEHDTSATEEDYKRIKEWEKEQIERARERLAKRAG